MHLNVLMRRMQVLRMGGDNGSEGHRLNLTQTNKRSKCGGFITYANSLFDK